MMPLNFPMSGKRSISSVWTMSLTQPGLSTNSILEELLPEIVEETTKVYDAYDVESVQVKMFLTYGFLGVYSAW